MEKPQDFFISYTGKDLAWAEWIAWIGMDHLRTKQVRSFIKSVQVARKLPDLNKSRRNK